MEVGIYLFIFCLSAQFYLYQSINWYCSVPRRRIADFTDVSWIYVFTKKQTHNCIHTWFSLYILGKICILTKKYMYKWKITSLTNVLTKPQSSSCIFRSLGVKKQPWPIGVGLLGSKLTNLLPWLADFPPIHFKLKLHFQSKFFGAVFKNMFPEHMKFQC